MGTHGNLLTGEYTGGVIFLRGIPTSLIARNCGTSTEQMDNFYFKIISEVQANTLHGDVRPNFKPWF